MKRKTMDIHSFYASSSTPPPRPDPPPAVVEPELEPTNVTANLIVVSTIPPPDPPSVERNHATVDESTNQRRQPIPEFHPSQIIADPGLRIPIEDYAPEIRSDVRRAYLLQGRNKAIGHNFKKTKDDKIWRSFQPAWFNTYDWLEYSVKKEAAFCFHCFLFKKPSQVIRFGNDVFTKDGYTRWKTALGNFRKHVGGPSSYHNIAKGDCDDFNNQRASVASQFRVYSKEAEISYKIRLTASLDCARYLIAQGEAFRGHDESSTSINKGNFRELLDWYKDKKEDVKEAFDKGPGNAQMICSDIQKDLARACAIEVTKVIKNDIGDKNFSILIDEARDCSIKEQMAVIVRFLDDHGVLQERFLAIKHITDCTSAGIKEILVDVLEYHGLSLSRLRGQGYDGASNMRGEFNGLQKLVRDEAPYAFYVHCFAHQLQLVVVTVAQCSPAIADFFNYIPLIVTQVCSTCKRKDALLSKHHDELLDLMENGKISAGTGLHQESSITRPGDTCWGSHLRTLLRIFTMWNAVVDVLGIVVVDAREHTCQGGARDGLWLVTIPFSPRLKKTTSSTKCMMLTSRSLRIANNLPQYWRWISLPADPRFAECAELMSVYFFAVIGEIPPRDLSAGTSYIVYLVYKLASSTSGLKGCVQTSSLRLHGERIVPGSPRGVSLHPEVRGSASDVTYPVARGDGWLELRLAEFENDDEMLAERGVIVDLREENDGVQKRGLIIGGMEFRSN